MTDAFVQVGNVDRGRTRMLLFQAFTQQIRVGKIPLFPGRWMKIPDPLNVNDFSRYAEHDQWIPMRGQTKMYLAYKFVRRPYSKNRAVSSHRHEPSSPRAGLVTMRGLPIAAFTVVQTYWYWSWVGPVLSPVHCGESRIINRSTGGQVVGCSPFTGAAWVWFSVSSNFFRPDDQNS